MVGHTRKGPARALVAAMAAGLLAITLALLLAPRLRTLPAGAQSAGNTDLIAELAERLLGTSPQITPSPAGFPPFQQTSSPVQLFPGALPTDLPIAVAMPPNSTLIGSAERPSFPRPSPMLVASGIGPPPATPTPPPSGVHVDVVFDASGTTADITKFYTDTMAGLGWSPPSPGAFGPGSEGGFLSSPPSTNTTSFCQGSDGPWLAVTVLPGAVGAQDVRLSLDTGNPGPCGSPFLGPPEGFRPPPIAGLGLLPRLRAPDGVSVQVTGGSGGGPGRFGSDAVATTDMSASDLEKLYERQVVDAGWTRVDGATANALAWSIWSIPDQSDWQGFLYVRSGPGEGRRSLHVEVASSNAQSGSGSYGFATSAVSSITTLPAVAGPAATPTATPTATATPPGS